MIWSPPYGPAEFAVTAVADGHGSSRCFRSETGSRIAVEVALTLVSQVMSRAGSGRDGPALEHLTRRVAESWTEAVVSDLERNPFSADELKRLEQQEGPDARLEVMDGPVIAYGTTLLAAGAGARGVVLFQIGDGDILTVSDVGLVTRPLPDDPRSVGNSTASLANASAWEDARTWSLGSGDAEVPSLVLAATDGYANSFADDAGFLQVGSDLLAMIRSDGLEEITGRLEGWLREVSELGSGDDVSIGLLAAVE